MTANLEWLLNSTTFKMTNDIRHCVKWSLYERNFDPDVAMQCNSIICPAYFAENPTPTQPGVSYCNSSFDSFSCWPTTRAGDVAVVNCPDVSVANVKQNVTKLCYENGTWAPASYDVCFAGSPAEDPSRVSWPFYDSHVAILIIYDLGYTITTIALFVALFIFNYFKSLRCLRNSIHCNLIVAFICSNISWLILRNAWKDIFMGAPQWVCKSLVAIAYYAHSAVFYWMFVEGLYLFTIIVWAFSAQKIRLWYYLIIGWGGPLLVAGIWAVLKANFEDEECWIPGSNGLDFIVHGPVLFMLACNVLFIVAIIWVLVTKMRASNTLETRQSRKAVRATIVLVPLLGLTFVLFLKSPVNDPTLEIILNHVNAVFQSCQGLLVAIFYCFLNGEVRSLLRQKLHVLQDSRSLSRYTKSSFFGSPRRSSLYAMTATNGKAGGKRTSGASAQSRVSRTVEAETEASAAMMDNML